MKPARQFGRTASSNIQVVTPGRGIDHDPRTLARRFSDGNLAGWLSYYSFLEAVHNLSA